MTLFGVVVLLVVAALVAALAGALASALHMATHGVGFEEASAAVASDALLIALCQLLGLGTATGVGVLATFGNDVGYREALDVRPVPAAVAVLALTAGFALQFPLHEVANLLSELGGVFAVDPVTQARLRELVRIDGVLDAITVPLAVVAIPAISEELLFRGLVLPGVERRHGASVALAVSSLAFGLIHVAPVAVVYATLAGFVLGWVRLRTGSVLPCVALHGAFNAAPILLPAEILRIEGFNTVSSDVYHLPLGLVLGSAAVAALSLYALSRLSDLAE